MKIAIIGGGAAGLMAAATIVESEGNAEIFLIEKNPELGKKVIISGGGRCNVTTGLFDVRTVLTRYPRGSKFLSSAMHQFPPEQVYAWFEKHGVPLKIEEDLRVFPRSDDGEDIVGVFEKLFRHSKIHVLTNTRVARVEKHDNEFSIFRVDLKFADRQILSQQEFITVDRLILTTGGQAYRQTGSTGDGYAFAQALGHSITPLAPSLNAFFTSEAWPKELSGLSFQKAKITAVRGKKFSYTGPFLFTHKGISGPAVFAVSSLVAFEQYDQQHPLDIFIDLFPDQSNQELLDMIVMQATANPKKSYANVLSGIIPKSLSEVLCDQLCITQPLSSRVSPRTEGSLRRDPSALVGMTAADKKAGEVSKKYILRCVSWLKAIPLHAIARGAGDEFVTAGGIDLKEVNPSTIESKICPGLFFAGEILDIDGFTGGFNLQASWATGRLAGQLHHL